MISQILASSPPQFNGVIFDASLSKRQQDLRLELRQQLFETVLDPMALELATKGGWDRGALRSLPWARNAQHTAGNIRRRGASQLADPIAEFVCNKEFSSVIAPTHFIEGTKDPWWSIDNEVACRLRDQLNASGCGGVPIYYRLAVSRTTLLDKNECSRIAAELVNIGIHGLWLCVHPVSAQSSGSILKSYIEFCSVLSRIGVPLVAERTGFLGLALLGFNAVGGIESGITFGERFDVNRLLRPPQRGPEDHGFSPQPRVYINQLGVYLDKKQAQMFFESRGMKRRFACQDRPCCKHPDNVISDPRRHLIFSRAQEVSQLGRVPAHDRPKLCLDNIRAASDASVHAVRIDSKFEEVQKRFGSWRSALGAIIERGEHEVHVRSASGRRIRQGKVQEKGHYA